MRRTKRERVVQGREERGEERELELQVSRVGNMVNKMRCWLRPGVGKRPRRWRRLGGACRLKCNKLNSEIFLMQMRRFDN